MKVEIIKAPTGSGKTQKALELAKTEKIVLAVPTVKLADEVYERAVNMGLTAIKLLGRNNYICGYKAKLLGMNIEELKDKEYRADTPSLKQDIVCCGRKSCEFDPFSYFKEKATKEKPDVIITTYEFLKSASFKPILEEQRTLVIDEIHSFIRSLKNPIEATRVSLQQLLTLLYEIKGNGDIRKQTNTKKAIKEIEKYKENSIKKFSIVFIVSNTGIKTFEDTKKDLNFFNYLLNSLESLLEKVREDMPVKSKKSQVVTLREKLTQVINNIKNIKRDKKSGFYGYVIYKPNDIEIGLRQVLFSPSMWFVFNRILKMLNTNKIIGMSATISKDVAKTLFAGSSFEVEYIEEPFIFNSELKMIVFGKPFEYEKKYQHLDYIIEKLKQLKKEKGIVILATSYEDIDYLYQKLSQDFSIVRQKENEKADDIVELYEEGQAEILIGNKSFWEGVNIKRDSDFVIVKMPYFSPFEVDFIAVEEYSRKHSYPINRKEALITLTQGLGRIIRNDGESKKVYIFDNRIKDFTEVIDELPVPIKLAVIDEREELFKEKVREIKTDDDFIRLSYFYTFKQLQKGVIRKEKIEQKEFSEIYRKLKNKDEEIREIFNVPEVSRRRNQIYGRLYEIIVKDFIEIYSELGIKLDEKVIAEKTKLTQMYIYEVKKKLFIEVKDGS